MQKLFFPPTKYHADAILHIPGIPYNLTIPYTISISTNKKEFQKEKQSISPLTSLLEFLTDYHQRKTAELGWCTPENIWYMIITKNKIAVQITHLSDSEPTTISMQSETKNQIFTATIPAYTFCQQLAKELITAIPLIHYIWDDDTNPNIQYTHTEIITKLKTMYMI